MGIACSRAVYEDTTHRRRNDKEQNHPTEPSLNEVNTILLYSNTIGTLITQNPQITSFPRSLSSRHRVHSNAQIKSNCGKTQRNASRGLFSLQIHTFFFPIHRERGMSYLSDMKSQGFKSIRTAPVMFRSDENAPIHTQSRKRDVGATARKFNI